MMRKAINYEPGVAYSSKGGHFPSEAAHVGSTKMGEIRATSNEEAARHAFLMTISELIFSVN